MNVAFVCCEYPPGPHGGIGTMVQVLGRALAAAGHGVRVVGAYPRNYPAPDYEEDHGVRVWRLRRTGYRYTWPLERIRLYRMVADWCRRGEIDIVEVPDYHGLAANWPRLRVPVAVRLHGSDTYFSNELGKAPGQLMFRLERASLRRADSWCSVSRYTAGRTLESFGFSKRTIAVLYNPVDLPDSFHGDAPRTPGRVVFSGTLTGKKGVEPLFRAWPAVAALWKGAELHVYGKDGRTAAGGSMREHLLSLLDGESRATVRFYGHVDRGTLFRAYETARAAVFPSYAEAFAIAPLEAMAHGCPTISSSRGSGPELLEHARHGLLVDPDREDEISAAIIRVLKDDGLARELGEAGRRRVRETFSTQVLLARNIGFYEQCLSATGRGPGRPELKRPFAAGRS